MTYPSFTDFSHREGRVHAVSNGLTELFIMHLDIFVQQLRGLDRVRELFYSSEPKFETRAVRSDVYENKALQLHALSPTRKDFKEIRKLLVDGFCLGLSSGILLYI